MTTSSDLQRYAEAVEVTAVEMRSSIEHRDLEKGSRRFPDHWFEARRKRAADLEDAHKALAGAAEKMRLREKQQGGATA